jgi:hypothetical protein
MQGTEKHETSAATAVCSTNNKHDVDQGEAAKPPFGRSLRTEENPTISYFLHNIATKQLPRKFNIG